MVYEQFKNSLRVWTKFCQTKIFILSHLFNSKRLWKKQLKYFCLIVKGRNLMFLWTSQSVYRPTGLQSKEGNMRRECFVSASCTTTSLVKFAWTNFAKKKPYKTQPDVFLQKFAADFHDIQHRWLKASEPNTRKSKNTIILWQQKFRFSTGLRYHGDRTRIAR